MTLRVQATPFKGQVIRRLSIRPNTPGLKVSAPGEEKTAGSENPSLKALVTTGANLKLPSVSVRRMVAPPAGLKAPGRAERLGDPAVRFQYRGSTAGDLFSLTRGPLRGPLRDMSQNPWTRLNDAISGRNRQAAPPRQPAAPVRPNTQTRSEAQAQADLAARRQREMEAAVRRAQAASPSRPLTPAQIAQIRARYQ